MIIVFQNILEAACRGQPAWPGTDVCPGWQKGWLFLVVPQIPLRRVWSWKSVAQMQAMEEIKWWIHERMVSRIGSFWMVIIIAAVVTYITFSTTTLLLSERMSPSSQVEKRDEMLPDGVVGKDNWMSGSQRRSLQTLSCLSHAWELLYSLNTLDSYLERAPSKHILGSKEWDIYAAISWFVVNPMYENFWTSPLCTLMAGFKIHNEFLKVIYQSTQALMQTCWLDSALCCFKDVNWIFSSSWK